MYLAYAYAGQSLDDFYAIVKDVRKHFNTGITMGHGHIGDGLYINDV